MGEIAVGFRALRVATSTPKFARALISMALGVGDVTATSLSSYCHTSANETEFCQTWNEIGPYIEVGLLSASVVDLAYGALRRKAGDLIENGNLPDQQRLQLEEMFPGARGGYNWFNPEELRNVVAKTPGVDNNSVTNLPKSFWEDAYVVSPPSGSNARAVIEDVAANGDRLGNKTEGLVDDIMQANGYQIADGKYYGENGVNGFDGVYYKGSLDDPTEIIIIESKQMNAGGSVRLSGANPNTGLPGQMSDTWINYVGAKLIDSGKIDTGNFIINNDYLIEKYVAAIDKGTGELNLLKIGEF